MDDGVTDDLSPGRPAGLLHAVVLGLAGVAFGAYVVVAQAQREQLLVALVACLALLGTAWLLGRRTAPRRTGWWEWASATTTFALLLGAWVLLDETDPTGPGGAPWSLRVVVVVVVALPLAAAGWVVLRDGRHEPVSPTD